MDRLLTPLFVMFIDFGRWPARRTQTVVFARLCVLLMMAQLAPGLHAGVNEWTGATKLDVRSIRFHPHRASLIYLATREGLFSTEDEGRTFTALTEGLPDLYYGVTAVELDPANPSTLYAIAGQALCRSDNGGREWRQLLTWDHPWREAKLAIDPQNGRTLYLVSTEGRIQKSSDGGKTWTEAMTNFTEYPSCLAVSPSEPEILYAGTSEGHVWKSTSRGAGWYRLSDPMPRDPVQSVVVDPSDSDTLYLWRNGQGLVKSTDGGKTWTRISDPISPYSPTIPLLHIDSDQPDTLFASWNRLLYRSLDGGDTWTGICSSFEKGLAIVAAAPGRQVLYGAGAGRLYRSADNGQTWLSTIPTVEGIEQQKLVIDPNAADTMYVLNRAGFSRSTDEGRSWRHLGGGLPNNYLTDLEVDPHDGRRLYVALQAAGVYESDDNGETWQPLLAVDYEGFGEPWSIKADPLRSGYLYAFQPYEGPPRIHRTTDAGQNWTQADAGLPSIGEVKAFVFDPVNAGTLYLGTYGGVFKSTDSGDTWRLSNKVSTGGTVQSVEAMAIDPRNPRLLYCSTFQNELFKSSDAGDSWAPIHQTSGIPAHYTVMRLTVSPHDSSVYAWTGYSYRSTDSGEHWTPMSDDFRWPTFSLKEPDALFAPGVMKSTDGGSFWYPLRFDLRFAQVSGLAIDPQDSNTVFVLVTGEGVYKSTDGARNWSRASEGLRPNLSWLGFVRTDPPSLFASGPDGVFRTSVGAAHWERVSDARMGTLLVDPRRAGVLYGITQSGEIQKTTDAGDTWTELSPGFPVSELAVSYSDPDVLYAGGRQTLRKSTDAGATWIDLNWASGDRRPNIWSIRIDPQDPSAVRVGACYEVWFEPGPGTCGSYHSSDGGMTWTEVSSAPVSYPDPLNPNVVYTNSKVSFDGGATWLTVPAPPYSVFPTFSQSEPRKAYVVGQGAFAVTLSQETTTYFPQVGAGRAGAGELQTELVFMNLGSESRVDLEFVGSNGEPMPVKLDESGRQSNHLMTICSGCTATVKTSDTDGLRTGYARVRTGINVHGTAVYGYSENDVRLFEAGVPSVPALQDATLFINRSQAGKDTGVAIANLGADTADVTLRLYDPDFNLIASRKLDVALGAPLSAGAHTARFLPELFDEDAAELEEGVLTVESDQPLAITSLLQGRSPQPFPLGNVTLTAMPVFEGRADGASPPFTPAPRRVYVPQVGNGRAGSLQLQSSVFLTNLDRGSISVRLEFFDSAGHPMSLPLAGQGAQSAVSLTLRLGQTARLTTDGSGPVQAGYAVVTAAANLGVAAVYHCFDGAVPMFEAGVPAVSRHSKYALFGSVSETTDTALALINAGTKAAHGMITLFDAEGRSLGSRALDSLFPLTPGAHAARYVSEIFSNLTAENGRVVIESDQPLAGVTLRQRDDPALTFPFEVYLLTVFPAVAIP